MAINTISSNISNINEDLIQAAEASVYPVDTEKSKISIAPESKSQIQDTLSISNDARSEKEKSLLDELKKIDREVQQHEAAHQAAAGELFRGKSFTYKIGPDGQRYAVAGDVQVDTSAIPGNPKATIAKMQKIRRAALAPGDPSSQDIIVAESAMKVEMQAEAELNKQTFASPSSSISAPEIKMPSSGNPVSSEEKKSLPGEQTSSIQVSLKDSTEEKKSISLNTGINISSLFGGQLNSAESRHIDISL